MRAALIDIGSNTLRLLIFSASNTYEFKRLKSQRIVTGLAKGMVKSSLLNIRGKAQTLRGIKKFLDFCHIQKVEKIYAIGTRALRTAGDAEDFVRSIEDATGIRTEIISGQREAELTYEGIVRSLDCPPPTLFLDIGGGSTEWFLRDYNYRKQASLPLGAITLTDTYITKDPPSDTEIDHARAHIRETIINSNLAESLPNGLMNIAVTGGTAATLACVDLEMKRYNGNRIHLHRITRGSFDRICRRFKETPFQQRRLIRGMDSKRAKIIIAGALILEVFWDICVEVDSVIISDYGLLEGFVMDLLRGNSEDHA